MQFTGDELGGKNQPMADLKSKARDFARQNFAATKVTVASDGKEIEIPWRGTKHAFFRKMSYETAIATTKLDQIIAHGTLAESVPDKKAHPEINATHYYDTPVVIRGKPLAMRFVV